MTSLQPGDTIGILGGGQLGRMMALAAARYGLHVHIYDPEGAPPAAEVSAQQTRASYTDETALKAFARACDVITYEFENIPRESLDTLQNLATLRPDIASLETSQDRLIEKRFLEDLGLAVAPYAPVDRSDDIAAAHEALGRETILKTRRLGYDGKGQASLKGDEDCFAAWRSIGEKPAVLETRVPFIAEISAIIVRAGNGTAASYDIPVNTHKSGILDTSAVGCFTDFEVPADLARQAQTAAIRIADALGHVGVLTAEFFVTETHALLVNEIAPRVHNSGHWTMDACLCDQFDNHVRAIAGWPLGSTDRHSDALMTNLIGEDENRYDQFLSATDVQVHLYGKTEARKGRKMGHITQLAPR